MKFTPPFTPELGRLIEHKAKRPELLEGFEIADDVLERHRAAVAHHHREKPAAEREAIAVYHALFDPAAPHSILARRRQEQDRGEEAAALREVATVASDNVVRITTAVELMLGQQIAAAKARARRDAAKMVLLAAILLALCAQKGRCQATSPLVVQGQNAGSVLFTRTSGLLGINCAGTLGCSFSGNVMTLNGGGGSGTMTNPMTTQYDVIYGGSAGTPTRLGIGANGTALGASGSALGYYSIPTLLGFTPIQFSSLSATSPLTYDGAGNFSCSTCVTSALTNPMTTSGDTIYGGASGAATRLAGSTSTTRKFLRQTGTGSASAAPAWDTLVSGDIPNNAANTSGNAATATALASSPSQCSSGNYATGVAASGAANCAQVAYSQLSGTLPNPSASTLGGVESLAAVSHNWINTISTSGVPAATRPACADLSDSAASCSTDATNASNISSGTLGAARLPNPSASTLGGVESITAASHKWINSISTSGVPNQTQPAFSDISGAATLSQIATQAADTVVMNATGSSAAPTAVAMPTGGTNGCAGASNALTYNTSTHALGCNTISGGGGPTTNQNIRRVGYVFDGGGSALSGTLDACQLVDFAGTIGGVSLIADASGSATVDVRTVAYSSYTGAASASSITASDTPALSSAIKYQDTTLTGWTTSLTANTVVCFHVTSPATSTWIMADVEVAAN